MAKKKIKRTRKAKTAKPVSEDFTKEIEHNIDVAVGEKLQTEHKKVNSSIAILALIINMLLFPGLGSLIGGKPKQAAIQIVMLLCGVLFLAFGIGSAWFRFFGAILISGAWLWALVTSIIILKHSE